MSGHRPHLEDSGIGRKCGSQGESDSTVLAAYAGQLGYAWVSGGQMISGA
jgi:hypothetical protein